MGGPLVDDEQPVPALQDLVGGLAAGEQQVRHPAVQARYVGDVASVGVLRQPEQAFGLVVGEQEPAFAVGDQHPFADGVEHRVVVLVHAGHLLRAEPVGLAAQASADERGAHGGQGEAGGDGQEDDRELAVDDTGDVLDGEARRDQRVDLAVGPGDRHDRLDLLAERAVHALGVDLTLQRGLDVADESFPDAVRLGVAVPDAVGVHHHDEVHPGGLARGLGEGLERLGRVGRLEGVLEAQGVGEGLGDGHRPVACLAFGVVARLEDQGQQGPGREQHHDRHLEDEYLSGDALVPVA